MHKQANHIKLDEAIKAALNAYVAKEERMSFDDVKPFIPKKQSKQPFKKFSFSLNSFAGALSLSSLFDKEAILLSLKKYAVAIYITAGTAVVGAGGIYIYNNVSFSNKTSVIKTNEAPANVNNGSFSFGDILMGNIYKLVKNTPNILQSVTTVTGQVSNPSQYTTSVATIQTNNSILTTSPSAETTINNNVAVLETPVLSDSAAEPVQLKNDVTEGTYDFSADPKSLNEENTTVVDSASTTIADKNNSTKEKKKYVKPAKTTKKKKMRFFSKEAFQH